MLYKRHTPGPNGYWYNTAVVLNIWSGVKLLIITKSITMKQSERRSRALDRLKTQLKSGVKSKKLGKWTEEPLTPKDINRIEKEIQILESRI